MLILYTGLATRMFVYVPFISHLYLGCFGVYVLPASSDQIVHTRLALLVITNYSPPATFAYLEPPRLGAFPYLCLTYL